MVPEQSTAQFRAVLQGGLSASSFRGGDLTNPSSIVRLAGGGGLRYEYPSGFEFETGLYYVVKGGQLEGDFEDIPIEGTSEITYVEVPFLIGYRVRTHLRFSPRLVVGPSMSFKNESHITFNAVGSSIEQREIDDTVYGRDLGLVLGLDTNARMGSETITFGVRSTFGLSNARSEKPEIYNTSVALLMGIVF